MFKVVKEGIYLIAIPSKGSGSLLASWSREAEVGSSNHMISVVGVG
jgi:hypothetical protein